MVPKHGDVQRATSDDMPEHAQGATCDWGECDGPTVAYRYDAWGHGWLPVCEACAVKPLEPVGWE